jgi:transposase
LGQTLLRRLACLAPLAEAAVIRDIRQACRKNGDGIEAYCRPENKVALGFVEALNNEIRKLQRRANGFRDEEYFRLKILTQMLPEL